MPTDQTFATPTALMSTEACGTHLLAAGGAHAWVAHPLATSGAQSGLADPLAASPGCPARAAGRAMHIPKPNALPRPRPVSVLRP